MANRLKKNNPGCGCCESAGDCPKCSGTAPAAVTVTMSGWSDGTCGDCEYLNSTFTLSQGLVTCYWKAEHLGDISCGNGNVAIVAEIRQFENYEWWVFVNVGGGVQYTYYLNLGNTNPVDCEAEFTLDYTSMTGTSICNYPATITVN